MKLLLRRVVFKEVSDPNFLKMKNISSSMLSFQHFYTMNDQHNVINKEIKSSSYGDLRLSKLRIFHFIRFINNKFILYSIFISVTNRVLNLKQTTINLFTILICYNQNRKFIVEINIQMNIFHLCCVSTRNLSKNLLQS